MQTKIVNYKIDSYDFYCGRPTIFGNPWSHKKNTIAKFQTCSGKKAVENYRMWLRGEQFLDVLPEQRQEVLKMLPTLKGKRLACWGCSPCHVEVLVELIGE